MSSATQPVSVEEAYTKVPAMPVRARSKKDAEWEEQLRAALHPEDRGSALLAELHRDKVAPKVLPFNAMVAKPITRKEVAKIPRAKAAMDEEWERLRKKEVWDLSTVEEWSKVASKARAEGREVAFGYVFGICVPVSYTHLRAHET